ncbi:TPA: hypothetical protein JDL67_003016 [Salmonella enterica subsp. salamae]|nr:hypothetical protein [Salmonella enterica subsp. salamae]
MYTKQDSEFTDKSRQEFYSSEEMMADEQADNRRDGMLSQKKLARVLSKAVFSAKSGSWRKHHILV